jgi:amino acid transporter
MAALYPAAGSAYTYVGRGLNPHLGFVAGWAMFLDYLVIPVVSLIYGTESLQQFVGALTPGVGTHIATAFAAFGLRLPAARAEYILYVILLVALTTFLNLRGIKWTALTNQILTAVMCLVIVVFAYDAIR